MRVLILGVSGLIGHQLLIELSKEFSVFGTLHKSKKEYGDNPAFSSRNIIENVNVTNFDLLKGILLSINPDVVINCVGITKRKINQDNIIEVLYVNSIFPHRLAEWAKLNTRRIIHFSTDCVFNGKVGNYNEDSPTTAEDLYGKSKALGELNNSHCLTIRSSFIGLEIFDKTELLEWFLAQKGKQILGFKQTLYSGVSTIFMSRVIKSIISDFPQLSGLYQLATDIPISKYDLLNLAKKAFKVNVEIIPDNEHIHLPTLNASKIKKELNLVVPSWEEMMYELAESVENK